MKFFFRAMALTIICLTIPSFTFAETVSIDPPEIRAPEVGMTLTLNIMIEGAEGLFGFEFNLSYAPEFLKFVSADEGDFLQSTAQTFVVMPLVYGEKPKDGGSGIIAMGVSQLGGGGVSGDGVLAQVQFEVIKEVTTPILLEFQNFSLFDTQANKTFPTEMIGSKIMPGQNLTPWDVNGDGRVNIFDLVLVGSNFGKSGEDVDGDVNGDGKVNIFDLVLVGSHFGESVNAAPILNVKQRDRGTILSPSYVAKAKSGNLALYRLIYELLSSYQTKTPKIRLALLKLEELIDPITETRLLANYPNPFNPETWIPYQLAKDATVAISIYNTKGQVIRTLHLGDQNAGIYITQDKAAYWDGKDNLGQSVASDVYYYTLQAGEFKAMRKMVVMK